MRTTVQEHAAGGEDRGAAAAGGLAHDGAAPLLDGPAAQQ